MSTSSAVMQNLIERLPLQRMESPSRGVSALVHVLGLSSFLWSFRYLVVNPNFINESYGWHFQYLTIIGLSLATVTFGLGSVSDVTLSGRVFVVKNVVGVMSAPLAVLITTLYWTLWAVDRDLVVVPELQLDLLPDLGFHAAPAAFLLVDILFLSPPWTVTALPALALSAAIAFAYWSWIELCYATNRFYPYPLFHILSTSQRVALFAASALLMAATTLSLKWLYGRVNGFGAPGPVKARPGNVKGT